MVSAIACPMGSLPAASVKSLFAASLNPGDAPKTVPESPVALAPLAIQLFAPLTVPTVVFSVSVARMVPERMLLLSCASMIVPSAFERCTTAALVPLPTTVLAIMRTLSVKLPTALSLYIATI